MENSSKKHASREADDGQSLPVTPSSAPRGRDGELLLSGAEPAVDSFGQGFPIVGIVASAGGLDAFKKFFTAMPADSGMAFVLIPHLDPTHDSLMVELLSKLTSMLIVEAQHDLPVRANCVYIIPPRKFLGISKGLLQLSEPPKSRGWQTSIDFFLRSLAQDQGERAIGIVLSGTGSHGALGVREIKLAGGMVMAQDPASAEYPQMPQNAIDTAVIDCILPPSQMPQALLHYIELPYVKNATCDSSEMEQSTDLLNQVLTLLQSRTKYDFRPYRRPMLLRRIHRRMGLAHIDTFTTYLNLLKRKPAEVTALYKDLLISVTAFFRDPEAFQFLEREVIPVLMKRSRDDLPIRVWVAGCATGEEAYSIAILLFEAVAAANAPVQIQLFASDIDADAIEVARAGIYPASVVADVSPERLGRFFTMVDEQHYQINQQLREAVVFSQQNLIGDAPFSKLNLISCRNLLIYLEPEMQQKVISLFHFALLADGHLLLGPSETIGRSADLFETVSKKWRVYRRIGTPRRDWVSIPLKKTEEFRQLLPPHLPSSRHRKNLKELTEQLVLNDYAPATAIINRKFEVLYVTGPLVNYLEYPRGELTKDLLMIARPGLRTKLRALCSQAIATRTTVTEAGARVKRNGHYVRCSVTVRPLTEPQELDGLMLVLFQDRQPTQEHQGGDGVGPTMANRGDTDSLAGDAEFSEGEEARLIQQLENELKSMSEELNSTTEEMESSTEELKTSNEEIMSVNEELQSVNEELETSKEELQSLNEELNTANGQLQDKVAELAKATDDLMNLMSSTEIATIFLDEQLNVKRFTPPTKALLNLLSTDVGRPLRDIAPKFSDDQMLVDCQQVLDQLAPVDREVETNENRYFLRRTLPYRTCDHHVAGVVITFVDLTERKRAEVRQSQAKQQHYDELHESKERLQAILDSAMDAIVTFDTMGSIDTINEATERLFGYQRGELIGQNISQLMPASFARPFSSSEPEFVKAELGRLVGKRLEVVARRKDGTLFPVDLAISRIDHLSLFNGILRDISDRKQLQAHILEIAATEQRRIGQELHDGTQQELIGLTLFSGALSASLDNATPIAAEGKAGWMLGESDYQQLRKTAGKLTQGLQEANQHVQKLSHGIMPVQIDAQGLRSALTDLATTTNQQQGVRCRFESSDSLALFDNLIATQLYRIAQEALNNALKHGQAEEIVISLYQRGEQIVLQVCDNGVGFDPKLMSPALTKGVGIGLRIMEYRAGVIGGDLQIRRNKVRGTTVQCAVSVRMQ
jgi:two-component system, chemotaxis family, CheB/CheR fusion protein